MDLLSWWLPWCISKKYKIKSLWVVGSTKKLGFGTELFFVHLRSKSFYFKKLRITFTSSLSRSWQRRCNRKQLISKNIILTKKHHVLCRLQWVFTVSKQMSQNLGCIFPKISVASPRTWSLTSRTSQARTTLPRALEVPIDLANQCSRCCQWHGEFWTKFCGCHVSAPKLYSYRCSWIF